MSVVFETPVPAGWRVSKLKHCTSFLNRGVAPVYVDDGPVRIVSQAVNQTAGLNWSKARFHSVEGDIRSIRGYLHSDDILINSTGTGTLGRVGYFDRSPDDRPCMADGHVTVVRVEQGELNPRFAFYWLSSIPFQGYLHSALAVGATNQIELSREGLSEAPVPLPSLGEQRRIADFLDAETAGIDSLAGLHLRVRARMLERREAQVFEEVVGSRYAERQVSGIEWAPEIPAQWAAGRIGLFASMGSGHTPSRLRPEWWIDCNIPWITTGEVSQLRDDRCETLSITREKISRVGLENSSAEIHPAGTVVLCRTAASAGYSAVMEIDMATSQDFATWTCGPRLYPYYLLWCLRTMRKDLLDRVAMGSTHKTIYVPDLQALKIPLPNYGEQHEIVERIRASNDENDRLVDAIDRQLTLLAERRQALITAAVTGKIDVSTATGGDVS